MGGAVSHNSHLNRRGLTLKLAFQRASAVCPCRGSTGHDAQKSPKYYTCTFIFYFQDPVGEVCKVAVTLELEIQTFSWKQMMELIILAKTSDDS